MRQSHRFGNDQDTLRHVAVFVEVRDGPIIADKNCS
jgi:hypothetical protein